MKTCGIYGIRNKVSGKLYVGQSFDIDGRYAEHRRDLRNNRHYNNHLQRSYLKYGESNFELLILEECERDRLATKEQEWVDQFPRRQLYNQIYDVQFRQGESNPFFGKHHTEITRDKMRAAKDGKYLGSDNPNFGKKQSLRTRLVMVKNNSRTKLMPNDVLEIKRLLLDGLDHQAIATQFNVSRTVITRISNGTRWANITGGPVVPVSYIGGIRQFSEAHRRKIGAKRKGCTHTEEAKEKTRQSRLRGV